MMAAAPTFTQDARSDLERYLRRVRNALRPHPSVDADEVERDIRGHIEAELAGVSPPVTSERLASVLDRLGSPNAWVPADDLSAWRRLLMRISSGPEDWRLAYLALVSFLLFPVAPPLLLASILLARAALALLEEQGEPVGARGWLLYPPLVFIYVDLAILAFVLAPCLVATVAFAPDVDPALRAYLLGWLPDPSWRAAAAAIALAAGSSWLVLGLVSARFSTAVRWVFWPFADWFERRHGRRIATVGFITAAAATYALLAMG